MRILSSTAILLAATLAVAPALAQSPVSPQHELSTLIREDTTLRERIGRIQLDALVSRVDQTMAAKAHPRAAEKDGALHRDLDLYTF